MANTKIPSELIADSSITAAKLADGTITTADIADSNVTTAKIADSNITTVKLGDNAVTTVKITDANITTPKIADDAVTTVKMASNSVTSDTIASGITLAGTTTTGTLAVNNGDIDIKSGSSIHGTLTATSNSLTINARNTGILLFHSGGVEKMRMDNPGNLLIGTNSGTSILLHATGSRANGLAAQFTNTQSTNGSGIVVKGGNNSSTYSADFRDYNNNSLMRVRGDGNVGIGDSAPSEKFTIKGDGARMTVSSADMEVAMLGRAGSSGTSLDQGYLRLRNQGVTANGAVVNSAGLSWFNGGNVGIGTDNPSNKLEIKADSGHLRLQSATTTTKGLALLFDNSNNRSEIRSDQSGVNQLDLQYYALNHKFGRNASLITMTLTDTGKVGIGTSSPQHELVIHNASNPTLGIVGSGYNDLIAIRFGGGDLSNALGNSNSGAAILSQQAVTGGQAKGDLQFQINTGDSLSTAMFIKNDGKVGMGTDNPLFDLHVSGPNTQIAIESTSTNQNSSLYYRASGASQWEAGVNITAGLDYEIYDRVNNASRFVVGHNGTVTSYGITTSHGFQTATSNTSYNLLSRNSANTAAYIQQAGSGPIFEARAGSASAGQGTSRLQIRNDGGIAIGANNVGYSSQILSVKSGTADEVLYGESTDANCFAVFRDNSSNTNVGFGAIGNDHVFRNDTAEKWRMQASSGYLIGQSATQVRLVLGSTGNSATNNSNWVRGNAGYLQFNSASSGYNWEIGGTNKMSMSSTGALTVENGQAYALTIAGNNNGLRFSTGTNQRIYWNTHRALEGSADGSVLQVGEGFTKILNQGREVWVADGVYHFKLSKTIGITGSSVTRHELNINTLIGAGTAGTLRYEVSIVGYGSGGANGLNAKYSVGGYSGHSWSATNFGSMGAGTIQNGHKSSDSSSPNAQGLAYHPAVNMGAYIDNGEVYAYSPGAQRYGFTVSNNSSTAMGGILTVEGVYT
jgi:ribosomal protein L27